MSQSSMLARAAERAADDNVTGYKSNYYQVKNQNHSVIEDVPWYREIEMLISLILTAVVLGMYFWHITKVKEEVAEISDQAHKATFVKHLQASAKKSSLIQLAAKQVESATETVSNKTHMDLSPKTLAHALHVLPWYWLVIWGGGSLVVTALGMTILIVIPGFFLLGNIAWTVVVLKCNAERLDTEEQHLRDLQDVKAREKFMRSLFSQIDADGNGTLDREEVELFSKQLETAQMSEEELTNAMLAMDADGDGAVTYEEFVAWFFPEDAAELGIAGSSPMKEKEREKAGKKEQWGKEDQVKFDNPMMGEEEDSSDHSSEEDYSASDIALGGELMGSGDSREGLNMNRSREL